MTQRSPRSLPPPMRSTLVVPILLLQIMRTHCRTWWSNQQNPRSRSVLHTECTVLRSNYITHSPISYVYTYCIEPFCNGREQMFGCYIYRWPFLRGYFIHKLFTWDLECLPFISQLAFLQGWPLKVVPLLGLKLHLIYVRLKLTCCI